MPIHGKKRGSSNRDLTGFIDSLDEVKKRSRYYGEGVQAKIKFFDGDKRYHRVSGRNQSLLEGGRQRAWWWSRDGHNRGDSLCFGDAAGFRKPVAVTGAMRNPDMRGSRRAGQSSGGNPDRLLQPVQRTRRDGSF